MLHLTKLQPNFASNVQMTSLKGCERTAEDKEEEERGERAGTFSEARGTGESRSYIVLFFLKSFYLKKNPLQPSETSELLRLVGCLGAFSEKVGGCLRKEEHFRKFPMEIPRNFHGILQSTFLKISKVTLH